MKVVRDLSCLKKGLKTPILTLGNFDGVHKGHQKIINSVTQRAKALGGTSVLLTFFPHPVKILAPELKPPLLQTEGQKKEILQTLGLDVLVVETFTKSLAKLNAEEFFKKILIKKIGVEEIFVGYDFTFGQHRTGTTQELKKLGQKNGINVHVIDAVFFRETLISSTHIRHFVETNNLKMVTSMLGRPYSIVGKIVRGRGVGSEIGFHTANLSTKNEIIPPAGVYITTLRLAKKFFPSITNIGYNPTFGGYPLSIETHILDFRRDILGENVELEFHKKTRREMTFETVDDLHRQISADAEESRRYHAKRI